MAAEGGEFPRIDILNGPNLNLLGERQPEIYGSTTLAGIEAACAERAALHDLRTHFIQSNHEGVLVDAVQAARREAFGIVINPAAFTHTSVALLDALLACDLPVIEVHLSNIHRREAFRSQSWISKAATGVICGFGAQGYLRAIDAMADLVGAAAHATEHNR